MTPAEETESGSAKEGDDGNGGATSEAVNKGPEGAADISDCTLNEVEVVEGKENKGEGNTHDGEDTAEEVEVNGAM